MKQPSCPLSILSDVGGAAPAHIEVPEVVASFAPTAMAPAPAPSMTRALCRSSVGTRLTSTRRAGRVLARGPGRLVVERVRNGSRHVLGEHTWHRPLERLIAA